MIDSLPAGLNLLFLITFFSAVFLFFWTTGKNWRILVGLLVWSGIHSCLAHAGIYAMGDVMPPPFALILGPVILIIIWGLTGRRRKNMLIARDAVGGTIMHVVRVPVELCLYYLFLHEMVPELMTFSGRNYDIIVGFTAPFVALAAKFRWVEAKAMVVWNIFGVAMVLFIMINGILSAPLPFQQFGFEQPNVAVMHFPYVLLPATIVPLVIYSHLLDVMYWRAKAQVSRER